MRWPRIASLFMGLWLVASASLAHAEPNGYMRLRGQKQGEIRGSVTQKGREGAIMVIALNDEIVSPRDPQSGLPTGQRMHKPFVIRKEVDRSTPALHSALTQNETLSTVTLEFWRAAASGAETLYLTITLTNANVASVQHMMLNNKNPKLVDLAAYEEVAFTYQKIEWLWNEGGIRASDTWDGSGASAPAGRARSPAAPIAPKGVSIPRTEKLLIRP